MLQYLLFLLVLFVALFILYLRQKFKFWAIQPVFHVYDFSYYIWPPGIINHDLPEKNRYCQFANVETIPYSKLSDLQLTRFTHLIRNHYLKNKDNVFAPQKENITCYFVGHNSESFFSLYTEEELLLDTKTNAPLKNRRLISVMTTRPLHIFINNGDKDAFFTVYYVDYLCVHADFRKKGIAPQIIQTHEYNQRLLNKNIKVSLFKREGDLTGIVPLCIYSSYGFEMRRLLTRTAGFGDPSIKLVEIGTQNMQHLTDFLKEEKGRFDLVGVVETGNLMELVKTKNIFCYIVVQDMRVLSAYFFRKTCTFMRKGVQVLSCFASVLSSSPPPPPHNTKKKRGDLFSTGFSLALRHHYDDFQFAVIEDISDNNLLIQDLEEEPDLVSPTAYFFYNFAYHTFRPNKVLLIL